MSQERIDAPLTVIEDPAIQAAADHDQEAREAAFLAVPEWHGVPLVPFSSGRESLFSMLRYLAVAPALETVVDDADAFFPDAIRILYLCSHQPEDWRALRRDPLLWQERIEAWADAAIPLHQKGEALLLAMQILGDAYRNRHEPMADSHGHEKALGN